MKRVAENLVSQTVRETDKLWKFDFVTMISQEGKNSDYSTVDCDVIFLTCSFGWGEAFAGKYPANRNNIALI